jgi:single stranded DNA-binding protein
MKKGINKVFLMGLVVSEPIFSLNQDVSVTKLTIVTSSSFKDKGSFEKKEMSEYHNVVFFGKLAAIVKELILKGFKIYVEGYLKTSKWQDKNTGEKKTSIDIVGTSMQIVYGFKEDSINPLKKEGKEKNQYQENYGNNNYDDNYGNVNNIDDFDFSFGNQFEY